MKEKTIHLGFEVGTGDSVSIPLRHLIITGQTRLSGKTTTLDAIVHRSGLRALTFLTKPGEDTFQGAQPIQPYFHDQGGWRFTASVLEATMGEKLKQERSEIINACKGTGSLAEVYDRIVEKKAKARSGWVVDVLTRLEAYFEIVLPQIEKTPFAGALELGPGVNLIDMAGPEYSDELRALIIRSALEWILKYETGVMTVIPEAWQFIPEGRGNPVKQGCTNLIRLGGVQNNWVGIDSQEVTAVDVGIRKSCGTWILGVQRELNEVKRVIDQLPGKPKPTPDEVMSLGLGQFFVSYTGAATRKVYVQPSWMEEEVARKIATSGVFLGNFKRIVSRVRDIHTTKGVVAHSRPVQEEKDRKAAVGSLASAQKEEKRSVASLPTVKTIESEEEMASEDVQRLIVLSEETAKELRAIGKRLGLMVDRFSGTALPPATAQTEAAPAATNGNFDKEALFQEFKARLLKEPAVLKVLASKPEITVEVERQTITMDGASLVGRIAQLLAGSFFEDSKRNVDVKRQLERTGPSVHNGNLSRELKGLVNKGFLTEEADGYRAVEGMKVNIVQKRGANA